MIFNLQRLLITIALVFIPFYEVIMRILPYSRVAAPDTRETKLLLAMFFSLAIGLLAVFEGKIRRFDNKWILFLICFVMLSFFMSPKIPLFVNGIDSGDFWFWKPFCNMLCMLFLVLAVASIEDDIVYIIKIMSIVSMVMGVYVLSQFFGLDQFFIKKSVEEIGTVTMPQIGGTLGNSTLVASFLIFIFPLSIYLKRYFDASIILLAVLATQSDMALISLSAIIMGFLYYFKHISLKFLVAIVSIIIMLFSVLMITDHNFRNIINNKCNGRIPVWINTLKDIRDGSDNKRDFSFTGMGLGRFGYIFPEQHKTIFRQAHNDFLEFTYNCGIFGLILFLSTIFFVIKTYFISDSYLIICLTLSFLSFLLSALGSFNFQLGVHQFYMAIIFGLLSNPILRRKK